MTPTWADPSLVGILAAAALAAPAGAAAAPTPNPAPAGTPLAHTHAHNDYLHEHPLFDALTHRFSSVEADIWLTDDGRLLVGHDKNTLKKGDTLEALYLDPLKALVDSHANHAVYAGSRASLQLLIDVKNTGTATYAALDQKLRDTTRRCSPTGRPQGCLRVLSPSSSAAPAIAR